jgi:hypothetical protein
VKNTLTAFGAQTRFVEEVTWSKHPKPAIRRSHLRAELRDDSRLDRSSRLTQSKRFSLAAGESLYPGSIMI